MTTESSQNLQPTPADYASLAAKFEAFSATLTPAEQAVFEQVLQHVVQHAPTTEDDTHGALFWLVPAAKAYVEQQLQAQQPREGRYPPDVPTDAAR